MGDAVVFHDDGFSRLRITGFPPLAQPDFEGTEPTQLDHAVLKQPLLDFVQEEVDDPVDVLLLTLTAGKMSSTISALESLFLATQSTVRR